MYRIEYANGRMDKGHDSKHSAVEAARDQLGPELEMGDAETMSGGVVITELYVGDEWAGTIIYSRD